MSYVAGKHPRLFDALQLYMAYFRSVAAFINQ